MIYALRLLHGVVSAQETILIVEQDQKQIDMPTMAPLAFTAAPCTDGLVFISDYEEYIRNEHADEKGQKPQMVGHRSDNYNHIAARCRGPTSVKLC